ncbi:MAG: hypothetical protein C0508_18180 [Cyanobacteria bacterium PR.023]|nr:hypothetical protein [Cyanobacteria bacterium PR.023]
MLLALLLLLAAELAGEAAALSVLALSSMAFARASLYVALKSDGLHRLLFCLHCCSAQIDYQLGKSCQVKLWRYAVAALSAFSKVSTTF